MKFWKSTDNSVCSLHLCCSPVFSSNSMAINDGIQYYSQLNSTATEMEVLLLNFIVRSFVWHKEVKLLLICWWSLLIFCSHRSLYPGHWFVLSLQLPLSHCQHNWRELLPSVLLPGQWRVWGGPGVYQHHQGRMWPHQTARTVSDWRKMSGLAW